VTARGERTLLILGASGDLAARLLLPGLGGLLASGRAEGLSLVGSAVDDWDDERWRDRVAESFAAGGGTGGQADAVAREARFVQADVTSESDWRRLLDACHGAVVVYFALPPQVTERACRVLSHVALPDGTRLALEKPFGSDVATAERLNDLLARLVPEDHVHRVDHFLGMSTVLDIVGLRFANRLLEPVLNAGHVECVDIVFDETLGLEGRAGYYDGAGALVDMIQSHLLQVLALVAMEPPISIESRDFRDARAQVLRAVRLWDDNPTSSSFRGRYTAGEVDGRTLPSYADEAGVAATSTTETLAEVVLAVDTWRWAGVPFRVRSGKAIADPRQEVAITFKAPPRIPNGLIGWDRPNRLRIGIAPGRGSLGLELNANGAGDPVALDPVTLHADLGAGDLPEYGHVLEAILDGNPTLAVRGDMAVDCWRIVEPVLEAWRAGAVPLDDYAAGSAGPEGWPSSGGASASSSASVTPHAAT